MVAILSAVASILVFRFRGRAALELKLVALQHQLAVLRRQRSGRPQLSSLDRLLWVLLYRIWPQVVDAMVLVKPATVVEWHRKGFRFYWRWRSRGPGRPRISTDIRALIRRMSRANPLWGAPRIHGELLKLGIKISQATVGRWMPWRPKVPSPTWRSFLRNHLPDIADNPEGQTRLLTFAQALAQSGWTDGRNVRIDIRWGAGDPERIRKYAAELFALAPDVILVSGGTTLGPLRQVSRTVPTVFTGVGDPVGAGFVRPGRQRPRG